MAGDERQRLPAHIEAAGLIRRAKPREAFAAILSRAIRTAAP